MTNWGYLVPPRARVYTPEILFFCCHIRHIPANTLKHKLLAMNEGQKMLFICCHIRHNPAEIQKI